MNEKPAWTTWQHLAQKSFFKKYILLKATYIILYTLFSLTNVNLPNPSPQDSEVIHYNHLH